MSENLDSVDHFFYGTDRFNEITAPIYYRQRVPLTYRVLFGFIGFYGISFGFTGFYGVLRGFTWFYRDLLFFYGFYWVLLSLIEFD